MFKTDRVVPAVIFLRPGNHASSLTLGGDWKTYMSFSYIECDLGRIPAERHMESENIVARLNLPNMAYPPEHRIDVYADAREGLIELEQNPEKRLKYSEFIDLYARLDDADIIRYRDEYLPKSRHKEAIMGFSQMLRDEGRLVGRQEERMITLNRLLSHRFENIPAWAGELLQKGGPRDLEQWTDRILDAKTIEDVFGRQQ